MNELVEYQTGATFAIGDIKIAEYDDGLFAFRCNLYRAGQPVAKVSSPGDFNHFIYEWSDPSSADEFDVFLIESGFDCRDLFVVTMVCSFSNLKWLSNECKTHTIFRMHDDPPSKIRRISKPISTSVRADIDERFGSDVFIFNDAFSKSLH